MLDNAMGKFLAELRKTNGYTQKDIAERINVSDKTVSKWERGDSSPDLALLPVLAEFFNVTCDELLRGEKSTKSVSQVIVDKGEKQKKYIITNLILKHKIINFACIGLSACGLVMQYLLGYLGNSVWGNAFGFVFHIASIIVLISAYLINRSSLNSGEIVSSEQNKYSTQLFKTTTVTSLILSFIICVFAIPMYDCYFQLSISVVMLFVWLIFASIVIAIFVKRNVK